MIAAASIHPTVASSPPPRAALSLQWQQPWPVWLALPVGLGLLGLVVWAYRREPGPPWLRTLAAILRLAVLGLVAAMLARPALLTQQPSPQPSIVAVLLDRSASMARRDHYAAPQVSTTARADTPAKAPPADTPPGHAQPSRWDQACQALLAGDGRFFRDLLRRNHQIHLYSFAEAPSPCVTIDAPARLPDALRWIARLEPTGRRTNLPGAIHRALADTADQPLAAIVVISDGRSTDSADPRRLVRAIRARAVPVFAVPVGSPRPPLDLQIESVLADRTVFIKDVVVVTACLAARALQQPAAVDVRLVRQADRRVLARQQIDLGPQQTRRQVELAFRPKRPGPLPLCVEVEPLPGETATANNRRSVQLNVIDRPLRVLYAEGQPRFEYRYLANYLLREPTIAATTMLLSSSAGSTSEAQSSVANFPATAEQLDRYHVVLFGDVGPDGRWIGLQQLQMLVQFVQRGGGFGLIAGPRHGPQAWRGTPIEKLLPVRIDRMLTTPQTPPGGAAFQPALTRLGNSSPIFRLLPDPQENRTALRTLPRLYWFAPLRGLKPAAEALAVHPRLASTDGPMPLIAVGHYGAGKTFYSGIDGMWRWRRYIGGVYLEAYWLQVLRYLAPDDLLAPADRALLETDARQYDYGQPVDLTLVLPARPSRFAQLDHVTVQLYDDRGRLADSVRLSRVDGRGRSYQASFVPARPGRYELRLDQSQLGRPIGQTTCSFRVLEPDLEARWPEADPQALARLAARTPAGRVVQLERLAALASEIPHRTALLARRRLRTLWDSAPALALLVGLIAVEWLIRRLRNLA